MLRAWLCAPGGAEVCAAADRLDPVDHPETPTLRSRVRSSSAAGDAAGGASTKQPGAGRCVLTGGLPGPERSPQHRGRPQSSSPQSARRRRGYSATSSRKRHSRIPAAGPTGWGGRGMHDTEAERGRWEHCQAGDLGLRCGLWAWVCGRGDCCVCVCVFLPRTCTVARWLVWRSAGVRVDTLQAGVPSYVQSGMTILEYGPVDPHHWSNHTKGWNNAVFVF